MPVREGKISMYTCGLTPDGPMHLGHAATSLYNDVLSRYLTYKGFEVVHIQNITDIDDDILKKSKKAGKEWKTFGDEWTDLFLHDVKKIGVLKDHDFKKATGSLVQMQTIIKTLLEKGNAYISHGSIYFDVTTFPSYGELSHFTTEQMVMIAKERGGNVDDRNKKHPLDFILWQKSAETEPFWESPWGKGRPGWHIECTAMIVEFLGERIDIHGGGRDLVFPHHESEIAQSESFSGKKPFAGHWFHIAMVMYEGEKMSKSLGNIILVSDLAKVYSQNQIRYYVLKHHYRFPWEYIEEDIKQIAHKWTTFEKHIKSMKNNKIDSTTAKEFEKAIEEDLCTPKALSVLEKSNDKNQTVNCLRVLGFTL